MRSAAVIRLGFDHNQVNYSVGKGRSADRLLSGVACVLFDFEIP